MPTHENAGKFGAGGTRPSGFPNASGKNQQGGGQPSSENNPSISQQAGAHGGGGKHHQKPAGVTPKRGSLANDMAMGRMGVSYMHNPAFIPGAEDQQNKPKQLPSQHIAEHGDDDHAIAHKHMDNARNAKSTDEKRKHTFSALSALNRAKRKGRD